MKHLFVLVAFAALLSQAAPTIAQDSSEPSIKSVLDAARAKYWRDRQPQAQSGDQEAGQAESESPEPSAKAEAAYTPILISFVPGVSIPFGYYDTSIAAGAIGNLTRDIDGLEAAGIFNLSRDIHGFEAAGVFNLSRNAIGFQSAGVFNLVDHDMTGFQSAGVFNIVDGTAIGVQSAGVFNRVDKAYTPFQGAGVFNIVGELDGFQAAGLFNIADKVSGVQAAGLFNVAKRISGVQIGVVNVADHIDGVQLGLVNIAGNGVGSLGLTYEPATNFFYAHLQAGTPALYSVAGMGAFGSDWGGDIRGFIASFGLGSRTRLLGMNIDLDVSASQPLTKLPRDREGWASLDPSTSSLFQPFPTIRLMAGLPLGGHFQIVGGIMADLDIDALGSRVPEALKTSSVWKASLFDQGFSAYYKWFLGFKI